jgi:hypothetical protein
MVSSFVLFFFKNGIFHKVKFRFNVFFVRLKMLQVQHKSLLNAVHSITKQFIIYFLYYYLIQRRTGVVIFPLSFPFKYFAQIFVL